MFIGGASGGAVVCLTLAGAYELRTTGDADFGAVALAAGVAGMVVAAAIGGLLGRRLGPLRATGLGALALIGAMFVTLLTTAADMALGRIGLVVLALVCVVVIVGARRIFYGPTT